jgi:hypothetical protein
MVWEKWGFRHRLVCKWRIVLVLHGGIEEEKLLKGKVDGDDRL